MGFVAPFLMGSENSRACCAWVYASSRRPASRYASLSQATRSAWSSITHGHSLLDRLLQQRQRVGGPSGKRIGSPHERGDSGDEQPEAPPARGRGAFEHRMACWQSPWRSA